MTEAAKGGEEMPCPDEEGGSGTFQPMAVSTEADLKQLSSSGSGTLWWHKPPGEKIKVPRKYRLVSEKDPLKYSLKSLRFGVLVAAINTKMLNPNYAIMATPGLHPDSFDNTDPFAFNSATYFLPLTSLLGVAISSIFVGQLSDRIGRKSVFLTLSTVSGFGSIAKYFARETFWGFCITSFVFGLFLGNLPVAMAYVGDVFTSKSKKNDELGLIVACFVMGNAGGGIIAILMMSSGLFAPLWVGAGLSFLSAIITVWYMIEPGDARLQPIGKDLLLDEEEPDSPRPEKIDQCSLWNIVLGALADNFGSTGLFPLCLSPLALEKYSIPFYEAGTEPIMTISGYQWLSVMVAPLVAPATRITPHFFARIGVASTCVFGNTVTAIVTLALLMIGWYGPATTAAFAGFVTVLYLGYPFTVFSQLTTGPMLDAIAPEDKIGFVQGLNNSAMNFGMALAPWLFGVLADATNTSIAIWTAIGVSLLAATINTPLMFQKDKFGIPPKPTPTFKRVLPGEDSELVEKALRGDFISPEELFAINLARIKEGKSVIVPEVKSYSEDKESIEDLRNHAEEVFRFRTMLQDEILAEINNPKRERSIEEMCELLNSAAIAGTEETVNDASNAIGQWFGDYMKENGYDPHVQSLLIKQIILSAFPPVMSDKEYTPENLEGNLLRGRATFNQYLQMVDKKKTSTDFGTGGQRFYS